jgi:hypothetical protein
LPPNATLASVAVVVGAVVSNVTVIELEAEDKLPAESEVLAVITLLPAVKVSVVHENAPLPLAVHVLPVATPGSPTYNCTMELASAVPVTTKDVFFVIKSLSDDPVSLLEASTRLEGAEGAAVSTISDLFAPKDPAAEGEGNVKTASWVEEFFIVPPFSASESVATYVRSPEVSFAWIM